MTYNWLTTTMIDEFVYLFVDIGPCSGITCKCPKIDARTLFETNELEASQHGLINYNCPCMCCHTVKRQLCSGIKKHLRKCGHDPYFQMPMVG
jgi:hypothetical protein